MPRPGTPSAPDTALFAQGAVRRVLERRALREHEAAAPAGADTGLMAWIPRLRPQYQAPHHLFPLIDTLQAVLDGPQRLVISTPVRHGKTESLMLGAAYLLQHDPSLTIGYVSYASALSHSKSRMARAYARSAGVELAPDAQSLGEWRTSNGGGMLAAGIGAGWTGYGVNCMVVDDPFRNRAEAESSMERQHVWESFNADLFSRLEPSASVIVVMARWHEDDLAGRLSEQGWPTVRLPAIDDRGHALWPERWPKEELQKVREQVGEYDWWSLYQGSPRPRGGALFRGTTLYDAPPTTGYRLAIATDLAYTARTRADWSVAILGAEKDRQVYILDVQRRQVTAGDFGLVLKAMQDRTGAMIHTRIAGPEIGTIDMLRERYGLRVATLPALADKFVTAQPAAAAWNAGGILVPHDAPWLAPFLRVVGEFSGVGDAHDDDVDALSTLYSVLGGRRGSFVG